MASYNRQNMLVPIICLSLERNRGGSLKYDIEVIISIKITNGAAKIYLVRYSLLHMHPQTSQYWNEMIDDSESSIGNPKQFLPYAS